MSEQVDQTHPVATAAWPELPATPGTEPELKSLAKHLARSATAEIGDRHVRAQVRTRCYNQTLALLRQVDERWRAQRRRLLRALTAAAATALTTTLALVAVLLL
ncbi:MAG: hypothetical protein RIC56_09040 [Pseudomonadales bacterium]